MKLLIVDDEENIRNGLMQGLQPEGYDIYLAESGEAALKLFRKHLPKIVITDLKMGGMDGLELTQKIKKINSETIILILTAHGTIQNAVDAIKIGAFDYLSKPIDLDNLSELLKKAISSQQTREDIFEESENPLNKILGESGAINAIKELIKKIATSKASVLITGESGTGKEMVAEAIHYNSLRKSQKMIVLNCSALSENLLESELFGHEKGAFTGAAGLKPGRFELGDGSTLFLDEIGEVPLSTQVKLLRVLQSQTFERVGGTQTLKVDVRIIAATNRDLEEAIKDGVFREDLYYRLNVLQIELPSLRERAEDIPLLMGHFLKKYSQENNKIIHGFSNKAKHLLSNYNWPGNIRELENTIESMVIMTSAQEIEIEDLPPKIRNYIPTDKDLYISIPAGTVKDAEKKLIEETLKKVDHNRTRAAEILGMGRRTLYRKILEYGIDVKKDDS